MPLTTDEIIFFARPSLRRAWFFSGLYFAAVIAAFVLTDGNPDLFILWRILILIMVIPFAMTMLQRYCTSYVVTERNVKSAVGVFSRKFASIPVQRITNFYASQTMLDRMLGIVTLDIDAAGGEGPEIVFVRINTSDAKTATKLFEEIIKHSKDPTNPSPT